MVYRFLLVSLNIDAILGEVTISARRQKLKEMTQGNHLGDAYATTLDRMKAQKDGRSTLGMGALMWVSNSERPLHTSELCHALGVKIGSTDLDHENVPEIQTILRCSLGLVTVEASSSTVRLVHYTLREYLSNNPSFFLGPHDDRRGLFDIPQFSLYSRTFVNSPSGLISSFPGRICVLLLGKAYQEGED